MCGSCSRRSPRATGFSARPTWRRYAKARSEHPAAKPPLHAGSPRAPIGASFCNSQARLVPSLSKGAPPALGGGGAFPAGPRETKPIQGNPRESKENPRKIALGFPWFSLDFLVRIGTFQWVTEQRGQIFPPWSASRARRADGGPLSQKRSVHMSNSGSGHYSAMAG